MTARPRPGFIGLGVMGRPMALNLIKAGYAMTVYARRADFLVLIRELERAAAKTVMQSP